MRKTLSGILALAFIAAAAPVSALVEENGPWELVPGSVMTFSCGGSDYLHTLQTVTVPDMGGNFTGTGSYNPDTSYTWDLTGVISGNDINFSILYTGTLAGSVYNIDGTIKPDGSVEATVNSNCQTLIMPAGSAVRDMGDSDGVPYAQDYCPSGTTADAAWDVSWGQNRWEVREVNGALTWYQNKVGKKGVTTPTAGMPISYTYGCNGHQILELLNAEFGSVMNGHWKYGLSSSVVEDFHKDLADGVLDGYYYLETVNVPANSSTGVASTLSLVNGETYKLKASGTASAGDGITFDADFSFRVPTSASWTDSVSTYEIYGDTLLDLFVDGGAAAWGDNTYQSSHVYWLNYIGTGAPVQLKVNDAYYPNNSGSLTVDIYAQI